jgi:hypothetical protein
MSKLTYALGGDHNADLFDCFAEFISLDGAVVVKVEVLESLHEDGLFALGATGFLR